MAGITKEYVRSLENEIRRLKDQIADEKSDHACEMACLKKQLAAADDMARPMTKRDVIDLIRGNLSLGWDCSGNYAELRFMDESIGEIRVFNDD